MLETFKFYDFLVDIANEINSTSWIRGEWDLEPNQLQWIDVTTGLPCVIRRTPLGCLCGYVAIVPSVDLDASDLDVHGGLTFDKTIAGVRWIGFDCSHSGDLTPGLPFSYDGCYRNIDYVKREIQNLVLQIDNEVNRLPESRRKAPCVHAGDISRGCWSDERKQPISYASHQNHTHLMMNLLS